MLRDGIGRVSSACITEMSNATDLLSTFQDEEKASRCFNFSLVLPPVFIDRLNSGLQ